MFKLGCASRVCFKNEILSGLTVALALVPEAVAFAFVAGVSPLVGLMQHSWSDCWQRFLVVGRE